MTKPLVEKIPGVSSSSGFFHYSVSMMMPGTKRLLWYFTSACLLVLVTPLVILSSEPFVAVADLAAFACIVKVCV